MTIRPLLMRRVLISGGMQDWLLHEAKGVVTVPSHTAWNSPHSHDFSASSLSSSLATRPSE